MKAPTTNGPQAFSLSGLPVLATWPVSITVGHKRIVKPGRQGRHLSALLTNACVVVKYQTG